MRIIIGGDHAGYPLKKAIVARLQGQGHEVLDIGADSEAQVDFPDLVKDLCQGLAGDGRYERGLLVCGTGIGASMAANKVRGVRAALAHDTYSAHQAVEHDDANVLCLGAWIVGTELAYEIVGNFLAAQWDRSDHFVRRVEKMRHLEGLDLGLDDSPEHSGESSGPRRG